MPFHESPDGSRLHYRLAGSGEQGLIFIHGWCGNTEHWEPQARAFARTHRVLRVDRRGDGRSDAPEGGYHPRDQADEMAGLIEALGLRDLELRMIKIMVTLTALNIGANALIFTFLA